MAQNTALQELIKEIKRVKPMGVPLDLEYDYDYYIEMDKNNVCSFLDWVQDEKYMRLSKSVGGKWFKVGVSEKYTSLELYHVFLSFIENEIKNVGVDEYIKKMNEHSKNFGGL